jgi:hypothetical protein
MKPLFSNLYKVRGGLMMHTTVKHFVPRKQLGEALVMDCLGRHPDDSSAPGEQQRYLK